MNQKKLPIKLFTIIKYSSTALVLLIIIDIIIARNIYHPLTYFYNSFSWLICQKTSSINCAPKEALQDRKLLSLATPSGKQGAVVTTQHLASEIGLNILQQGGNAIDAAVAIGYALAVTEPCCGNLGGGGFMLIHLANGKNTFINFREKAPFSATANMYLDEQGNVIKGLSKKGYLSIAIPGTVKGLNYALSNYGTMNLDKIIEPAIDLAEKGFILQKGDVNYLQSGKSKFKDTNVKSIFLKDNRNFKIGDLLVQKDLAKTLKIIAKSGNNEFYQGEIAKKIVEASQENGGILSKKDFVNYNISEQEPIKCNYRGYQVISAPPPGGGTTLCQMLNILSGYPLEKLEFHSTDSLHLILSSMALAYADRNTYLGDPDFVKIPLQKLLSEEYTNKLRNQIKNQAITPQNLNQNIVSEGTNTTHYSVVDKQGNAVAVTYTINSYFGAGVIAKDTGFFLNNEMDDFTAKIGIANQFALVQGNANKIEPNKRPLSSMSPTIVTKNGQLFLVTGSPGGSTIPTTVLQIIINMIDYKMSLDKAVFAPKIHYQGVPNLVITEPFTLEKTVFQNLWEKGYRVIPFFSWGAASSINVNQNNNSLNGTNDPRKSAGKALTY